jgi:hypothetical protein
VIAGALPFARSTPESGESGVAILRVIPIS